MRISISSDAAHLAGSWVQKLNTTVVKAVTIVHTTLEMLTAPTPFRQSAAA